MKKFLLWTFERGSIQYDVICGIILAFMFLTPRSWFQDQPEFMRVNAAESVHTTIDKNGNMVLTVKLEKPVFFDLEGVRREATKSVEQHLGKAVAKDPRMQPIYDWTGHLIAYAVWVER